MKQGMAVQRQWLVGAVVLLTGLMTGAMPARGQSPVLPVSPGSHSLSPDTLRLNVMEPTIPDLPPLGHGSLYLPAIEDLTYVVLRLGDRRVYVYQGDTVLASYPVAIGKPSTPTPTGEFRVFQMITNPSWQSPWTGEVEAPGPDGSLGLRWIGFATMSNGIIGFHGTPNVGSIGQAASNGCIRMHNEDVVQLYEQIEIGMLVKVEP
ncbi:MAG: hypothetical protein Kow00121_03590 [Elainellaceae cyanobacterium]